MLWILFWGLTPPIAVGYYSYRQGKRGYNEAIASRDAAMSEVKKLYAEVKKLHEMFSLLHDSMTVLEGSYEEIKKLPSKEEILNSVQKSIQGTYGRLIRSGKEAVQGEIDELAQDVRNNMSPEEVQAAMGQKMLGALQNKVMSFFE